jgi:hypothetical protein
MEIGQPVTLTRLPRSPHETGATRTAPVFGIRAGQKRKRQEVCSAVDVDSISIYEVCRSVSSIARKTDDVTGPKWRNIGILSSTTKFDL